MGIAIPHKHIKQPVHLWAASCSSFISARSSSGNKVVLTLGLKVKQATLKSKGFAAAAAAQSTDSANVVDSGAVETCSAARLHAIDTERCRDGMRHAARGTTDNDLPNTRRH